MCQSQRHTLRDYYRLHRSKKNLLRSRYKCTLSTLELLNEVSYLIAKSKKPFTVGEELLHPAAVKIAEIVLGSAHALEVKKIPLSNDTVARRVSEISENQLQQLIDRVKNSPRFAIQLDESTDNKFCSTNGIHQICTWQQYAEGYAVLSTIERANHRK